MRLAGAFDAMRRRLMSCCCCCLCLCLCLCWLLVTCSGERQAPRYLVYPQPGGSVTKVQLIFGLGIPMEVDVSTIVGYVMKCNYNLPYNASYLSEPYTRYERSAAYEDEYSSEEPINETISDEPSAGMGRRDIYQMIETAISSGSESEGKPCLLRAICEAAVTPLNTRNGIFAQLLQTLLTPSSTEEPIDQQYLAAQRLGAREPHHLVCAHAFAECRSNFLDYFSEIH